MFYQPLVILELNSEFKDFPNYLDWGKGRDFFEADWEAQFRYLLSKVPKAISYVKQSITSRKDVLPIFYNGQSYLMYVNKECKYAILVQEVEDVSVDARKWHNQN